MIHIFGSKKPQEVMNEIPARVRRQFNNTLSLTVLELRWITFIHLEGMKKRIEETRIPEMRKQIEEGQKLEWQNISTILEALNYELGIRGILAAKDRDEALALAKAYDKKQFKMHV